jgi:hypothetical protein
MATRSSITLFGGGKYHSIYSHWDGYPDHVGDVLVNHYEDVFKIWELISGGNVSSLDESVECPAGHSFDSPASGCTVFYGRDRGEEGQHAQVKKSFNDCEKQEWNYLFLDGTWYVQKGSEMEGSVAKLRPVTDYLKSSDDDGDEEMEDIDVGAIVDEFGTNPLQSIPTGDVEAFLADLSQLAKKHGFLVDSVDTLFLDDPDGLLGDEDENIEFGYNHKTQAYQRYEDIV